MKFIYPGDSPERALRIIELLRGPNVTATALLWLRRMLTMEERHLTFDGQLRAVEGRITAHLIAERLKK